MRRGESIHVRKTVRTVPDAIACDPGNMTMANGHHA